MKKLFNIIKGLFLALRVLVKPNGGILALIELGNVISDSKAARLAADKIQEDPDALALIDEKYSLGIPEPAELEHYAEGTLGKELWHQLAKVGFQTYPVPIRKDYSNAVYIRERRREIHDLLHVVLGYDTTYKGEACLNAFLAARGAMPICVLIPVGIVIRHVFLAPHKLDELISAIGEAWSRGKSSHSPFSVRWETYLEKPVEEAQAALVSA